MAVTQPTLGGSALGVTHDPGVTRGTFPKYDSGYEIRKEYRGGSSVMADGSVLFDLVVSGTKRVVTFQWINISETARDAIDAALAAMGTGSATLVTPENDSITVTLDENMTLPAWVSIVSAGNLVYTGSVTLREV